MAWLEPRQDLCEVQCNDYLQSSPVVGGAGRAGGEGLGGGRWGGGGRGGPGARVITVTGPTLLFHNFLSP